MDISRGAPVHARLLASLTIMPLLPQAENMITMLAHATQGVYTPQLFASLAGLYGREQTALALTATATPQAWLMNL
jgi:hypothetical protein